MKLFILFALWVFVITPWSIFAADEPTPNNGAPDPFGTKIIAQTESKKLSLAQIKSLMEAKISDISIREVTELPNLRLFQVVTEDYSSIFVSQDGNDFILGEHFSFDKSGSLRNLSKERKDKGQFATIRSIPIEELIIFPPKEKTKKLGWILVFTDIDCGYCRKLHRDIQKINAMGIEVRYAFFPRTGPNTESFEKAINVWCGEEPTASMTAAKSGLPVAKKECPNPVLTQYKTGIKVGVRGTPTIFTENGKKIPGYIMPEDILKSLQS